VYGSPTSWLSPTFDDSDNVELLEKNKHEETKERKYGAGADVISRQRERRKAEQSIPALW